MKTTRRPVLRLLLSVGCVFFVAAAVYNLLLFDPFEWGVVRSEHFTWEKFSSVKEGDQIDRVIKSLGEPIRRSVEIEVMTTNPNDPCSSGGCRQYLFAGARWGASYKEAIVVTDSDGKVLFARARQE